MPKLTLYIIVISQFACTSVWFAVNAIMPELATQYGVSESNMSLFTSAIQLGFIAGTLIFALWGIADKYNPTKIFLISALISAFLSCLLLIDGNTMYSIVGIRFLNGICLAGIYPIGIKIAADLYTKELPKVLSLLVGTLVLGTALPHLLNYMALENGLYTVVIATALLSTIGGILIGFFIPYKSFTKRPHKFELSRITQLFTNKKLTQSAYGYFGHMWELYAFWAFLPVFFKIYNSINNSNLNVSLYSFLTIAVGFISCYLGSKLTNIYSSKQIAQYSLLGSFICCFSFPFMLYIASAEVFIGFMLIWGMLVIVDSPQLSTLVAQTAPEIYKGTAITIVNCIGFAITIVSIQLISILQSFTISPYVYLILAIGPLLGVFKLKKNVIV